MVGKALVAVIQEAWINGVSTRAVDNLVKAMGDTGMSKSQVIRIKIRDEGLVRNKAIHIALGVMADGTKVVQRGRYMTLESVAQVSDSAIVRLPVAATA